MDIAYTPELDAATREELIRHWMDVNDAGGAVGFEPGATYEEVSAALDKHLAKVEAGDGWLYIGRDGGRIVAWAFWIAGEYGPESRHVATIKRLQVHPSRQGEQLGAQMMAALHTPEALERLGDVDFLHLQYRAGMGLGAWYARCGYTEIARFDLFRKRPDGTYGGWAEMLRTVDGSPLPAGAGL